ncbi:MAG: chorismate mutase [Bacillota bacterium]
MFAIRGATTVKADTSAEIKSEVKKLAEQLFAANQLNRAEVVSIIFSSTKDITSYYPAKAFRDLGYSDIPLFSCQEPDISEGLVRTIRLLVHVDRDESRGCKHIYLNEAAKLRPDLK